MRIAGLQKLTLLDYPGKTAATVFTPGCNFRCPFCHNADLVRISATSVVEAGGSISLDECFAFLNKRRGLLDGVCVTGGEPLLQAGLADFCSQVHDLGFAVKIDTNGSFPDRLQALVEAGLIDYIALDVKNAPARYAETIGLDAFDPAPIQESIDFLLEGRTPYEFRTTVARELHAEADLLEIAHQLQHSRAWFLQSYVDAPSVLVGEGRLHAWRPEDLRALLPRLQAIAPAARLRGLA